MAIQQITAFLEDRPRALQELLAVLARGGINLRALSMAETRDYGVVRLIVSQHERALHVLRQAGIPVRVVPVMAAELPDRPGGLAEVVGLLSERGVDIHYCYAFFTHLQDRAWVIFRVADHDFATSVLTRNGVTTLGEADLATRTTENLA